MKYDKKFRDELKKVLPGYKWTVHKQICNDFITATGIQSAGMARTSTIKITRRDRDNIVSYSAKSAGYSCNAEWLGDCTRSTLKQALRSLQDYYEHQASKYSSHAFAIKSGRLKTDKNL